MLKARTRWQLATYEDALVDEIATHCNIAPVIARLLMIRGMNTPELAQAFLQASVEQFHDPYLLDGMEASVNRIRAAIEQREPICIYGDYDADGVSSTSLMVHTMRQLGAVFDTYIPNRFKEGYGLNKDALQYLHESGTKLVVTVDTGISAVEQVEYGKSLGLDIIVTDHHEPPEIIPDAYAVINPKKPSCHYPFEMLAGVGVAFKLAHALLGEPPLHLLDLAAIGTIADLVPLVDENRLLASLGLRRMNQTRNPGLQALIKVCGLEDTQLTAGHVGFALGPRINAVGRLETAEAAVKLLTTDNPHEAVEYAQQLDDLNRERQDLVQTMTEEAIAMVEANYPIEENAVLVVAKEGWNVGVVGIVASRLVERYYRPTIVLGIDPEKGTAKGSARSIVGFDLYEALTACQDLLPHYGGHTMAAGMTLPVENVQPLRERLHHLASERLTVEDFIPLTKVDLTIGLDDCSTTVVEQMEALAPFGLGNPTPLVMVENLNVEGMRKIGRDATHLKCTLKAGSTTLDAIGFGWAEAMDEITPHAKLQVVGELSINEWNGVRKPQLIIRDLAVPTRQWFDWRGKPDKEMKWKSIANKHDALTVVFNQKNYETLLALGGGNQEKQPPQIHWERTDDLSASMLRWDQYDTVILYDLPKNRRALARVMQAAASAKRIYCLFGEADLGMERIQVPTREQFKQLYQVLSRYPVVEHQLLDALARKLQVKPTLLAGMLEVFIELGFVTQESTAYHLVPDSAKKALDQSKRYQEWMEEAALSTELMLSSYDSLVKLFESLGGMDQPTGGPNHGF